MSARQSVDVGTVAAWAAYEVRNQRAAAVYDEATSRLVCRHEGCDRDYGSRQARSVHEKGCRFREAPAELST